MTLTVTVTTLAMSPAPLRAIVTRPLPQAADWVDRLGAAGIEAVALPLIEIAPPVDAAALDCAWARLDRHRMVFFVSPAAVGRFFASRLAAAAWPDGVLAGASGPGTSGALRAHGVPADAIVEPATDALQFDSEALWQVVSGLDWRGCSVLVVRGENGRDWLADRLDAAGARVLFVEAYRRVAPRFAPGSASASVLAAACAAPLSHCWLFSSSQAIDHLVGLQPDVAPWACSRAVATHPRIGERARRAGFGHVALCRPTLPAVVQSLQSAAS